MAKKWKLLTTKQRFQKLRYVPSSHMSRNKGSRWKSILLLISSISITLIFSEITVRWLLPDKFNYVTPEFIPYQNQSYRMTPGLIFKFVRPEYSTIVFSNKYGFRGHLPSPGKGSILYLGDSFTFGQGVNENASFFGILRERHPRIPMYNFGMMGYCLRNQIMLMKEFLPVLKPCRSVLALHKNDLYESSFFPLYIPSDGTLRYNSEISKLPGVDFIKDSRLFRFIFFSLPFLSRLTIPKDMDEVYSEMENFSMYNIHLQEKWKNKYYARFFQELTAIKKISSANRADLVLFVVPSMEELYPERYPTYIRLSREGAIDLSIIERSIGDFARRKNIQFIPVLGKFQKAVKKSKEPLYFFMDRHLNEAGHLVLANLLDESSITVVTGNCKPLH